MRVLIYFYCKKNSGKYFAIQLFCRIIFAMPIIQLLVLPWAADYEVKNIKRAIVTMIIRLIPTIDCKSYCFGIFYFDRLYRFLSRVDGRYRK